MNEVYLLYQNKVKEKELKGWTEEDLYIACFDLRQQFSSINPFLTEYQKVQNLYNLFCTEIYRREKDSN